LTVTDDALAAGHRVDPGQRGRLGERDLRLGPPAAQLGLQGLALLIAHHVQVHADRGHARQFADRRGDLADDGVPQRAPRHGQPHLHAHRPVRRDVDALDHAKLGDGPVDLGVLHTFQGLGHLLGAGR
jgi:hypothetical protein